jgi:subtilisin family serine protease
MDYQALLIGILPGLGFPLAILGIDDDRYDVISAVFMITLALFGPFAFADPRETRLIALVSEETAMWSFRAATINFFTGWFLTLVLGLLHTRVLYSRLSRHWLKLAGVAAIAAIVLHFMFGQPGFYGDSVFVVLKDQADLSQASSIADVDARRVWIYETLTNQADETQPDLMSWLDQRRIPYRRYYLVNGLEVKTDVIRRWQLARQPAVERVIYNPNLRPIPELPSLGSGMDSKPEEIPWGIEAIGAPRVWSELGITGAGVVMGQSDSGVDASHPALASTYRGNASGDAYNWYDPWYGKPAPYDINGHGTHTLGTAVGQTGVGVAPGASWFACANLVRAFGSTSHYLDCMQFMLAPQPPDGDPLHDGRPDMAADISTNSWGCPPNLEGCDQLTLWQATDVLREAGIFFVAAAGNEGPGCDSMETPPGNYDNVFSVGAIDPNGDLADFSSRGPDTQSPDASSSPELLAPGVEVLSAWPDAQWQYSPGTSMAAPHVAGVVALMWSANPKLRGDIDATERILLETAAPYNGRADDCGVPGEYPDSGAGYGIVDAYAAVKRALELP